MRRVPVAIILALTAAAGSVAAAGTEVVAAPAGGAGSTGPAAAVAGLAPPWDDAQPVPEEGSNATLGASQRVPDLSTVRGARTAVLVALERAGLAATGLAGALLSHEDGTAHWRWSRLSDDLDGDGLPDVLRNDVDLATGAVDVHALSGADGTPLWSFEHGVAVTFQPRGGLPIVRDDGRLQRSPDVNGDGIPDVMVLAMDVQGTVVDPLVEAYAIPYAVHALDGRSGGSLWQHAGTATWTLARTDPMVLAIEDLPTGWLVHEEPRTVLKTTDVTMTLVFDPTCYVGCVFGFWARDVQVSETVTMLDGGGRVLWTRDIPAAEDPEHTRWTWITGVAGGGGTPRLVLDTLLESRPQASEFLADPIDGGAAANYGRGMEVRVLDWRTGADIWQATVFDELAWRVRPPTEEAAYPVLVWTHADVLPDLDGDGIQDAVASYLVQEQAEPGGINGQWRTHFVPLSGADGQEMVRHQARGWGYASSLGTPGWFAVGTVDLPAEPAPGGAYPDQWVQLAAVDAALGPIWVREEPFVQASGLSYELALVQLRGAITMTDLDGDGVREVVGPPQYVRPTGANQTLASTATHRYSLHSGASGDVLYEIEAWGRAGFVVPCPVPDASLVFLTGHGRRVEATRIDIPRGAVVWQQTMLFDERPRPATAPVNVIVWGGACDHLDGMTSLSNNMATAFLGPIGAPEVEAPSSVAAIRAQGVGWVDPSTGGAVPTDVLFTVRATVPGPLWSLQNILLLAGSVVGGVLGGAFVAWSRRPRRRRPGPEAGIDMLGKDPLGLGWRLR